MRLIDADELLKHIPYEEMCSRFAVENAPTIEPDRKKGRWILMSDRDGVYWACSECGEDIPRVSHYDPQFDLFPRLESIEKTDYCPHCGADLRGEKDDSISD